MNILQQLSEDGICRERGLWDWMSIFDQGLELIENANSCWSLSSFAFAQGLVWSHVYVGIILANAIFIYGVSRIKEDDIFVIVYRSPTKKYICKILYLCVMWFMYNVWKAQYE